MPELKLGRGHPTERGLGWFVGFSLGKDLPENAEEVEAFLDRTINEGLEALGLSRTELSDEEDVEELVKHLENALTDPYRREFWIASAVASAITAKDALAKRDERQVAFHVMRLSHARSMRYFYENLQSLVWRGYQAFGLTQLRNALVTWQQNETNDNEQFWQKVFNSYPFLLTQLIAGPAIVVGEKIYVGGKRYNNRSGKLADFLVANNLTGNVALLELKTPCTKLLASREYRSNVFAPSAEVGGAVNQVLSYRRSLLEEWRTLFDRDSAINPIHPKCYVIAGRYQQVVEDSAKRDSFELYRSTLHDVEIIAFDELFASAEGLLSAFEQSSPALVS